MNRTCPKCRAANVRRSSTRVDDITWRNYVFSRYRCRECLAQFWVISRKTYVAAASFLAAIVLAIIAVFVLDSMLAPKEPARRRSESVPLPPVRLATETPGVRWLRDALAQGASRPPLS
jgi:hypothetical protein